jgi:hypothetical protein
MYEVQLYDKIDALWSLCVAVGAAVCNSNIHTNKELTEDLSKTASDVRDILSKLENRVREVDPGDALDLTTKGKAEEKFAAEIEGKYGAVIDALIQYLAHWNFILQVEQLNT